MVNKYNCWYSITPLILKADNAVKTVTIHPQQSHIARVLNRDYIIKVTETGTTIDTNVEQTMKNTPDTPYIIKENGDLVFEMTAAHEGEYSVMLFKKMRTANPQSPTVGRAQ